jgi:asparagine synthase (glutamine-hydrolysing)
MCGITVFFGDHTVSNLDMYFKAGSKRGPEQYTYECNQDVHMGFHRLAINGLDVDSSQPLHYKHYVMVCNGEIYNYKELIERYNFKMETQSDCEVILKLYDLMKENCVYELDGEFSFVIHDMSNDRIFAARDPFGVRPLYINSVCHTFCLSSDLSPMRFYPLSNVTHFPPGHYSVFVKQTWGYTEHTTKYHTIHPIETSELEVYNALCNAVYKRVINTERPVACLLSGGLDSSLVAALAATYCNQLGKVLETYSIGLSGSEDLKYSLKVAEHIGSRHTQIVCSEKDFLKSIPQVIKDIESYDTTTVRASVGNWNIGKYIREHSEAKVILNGDGADELMGGYMYFSACPDEVEFDKECHRLLNDIHKYDVLRSDKSIASHGLEPRTPYLDKSFVDAYLSLPVLRRFHRPLGKIEKHVIREIIQKYNPTLLPPDILYRRKEAFSDGVSSLQKSWYEIIQENVPSFDHTIGYSHNPPTTGEQQYYRSIFSAYYKECERLIPYYWLPKFVHATDASARTLSQYKDANTMNQ